jgi:hypothetical protein
VKALPLAPRGNVTALNGFDRMPSIMLEVDAVIGKLNEIDLLQSIDELRTKYGASSAPRRNDIVPTLPRTAWRIWALVGTPQISF